jgi:hypothetical protein
MAKTTKTTNIEAFEELEGTLELVDKGNALADKILSDLLTQPDSEYLKKFGCTAGRLLETIMKYLTDAQKLKLQLIQAKAVAESNSIEEEFAYSPSELLRVTA